ncbi:MAG: hypothetical protein U5K71_07530 [Gracilimonas sp.]|nr:hypothetical protein [Gracilimonas sp.]
MQDTIGDEDVAALAASLLKGFNSNEESNTAVHSNGMSDSMWWKNRRE